MMDQSKISKSKSEEKGLNVKIYQQLSILSRHYGSTEDLKKCLSEDMFNKSNPNAFFHVMHFLFNLYDPGEFKKRFFWPIIDKKSESNFRTATMDYLKYLNEKHDLQWANIKTYLVVMPGGSKFISFLWELMCFIVKEMKKKVEKLVSEEDKELFKGEPLVEIQRIRQRNMLVKELASQYIEQVSSLRARIRNVTSELREELEKIAKSVNLHYEELNEDFIQKFQESNDKLFKEFLAKQENMKESMKEPIEACKTSLKNLEVVKNTHTYNENNVKRCLMDNGILKPKNSSQLSGIKDFSLNDLIECFNIITPRIQETFGGLAEKKSLSETNLKKLDELQTMAHEVQNEWDEFIKKLKVLEKSVEDQQSPTQKLSTKDIKQRITDKFVSTPTIKLDLPSCSRDAVVRLPLLEDSADQHIAMNNLTSLHTPSRRNRKIDCSLDRSMSHANTTLQRSKIIDPMELLRTISKEKTNISRNANLSVLSSKWKQNQKYLTGETILTELNSSTLIQSPSTPFSSNNERTRIECTPFRGDTDTTSKFVDNGDVSNSNKQPRKSAVLKVQEDIQLQNLNSSPSGRLEALVPFIPKIVVTNESAENMPEDLDAKTASDNSDKENDCNTENNSKDSIKETPKRKSYQFEFSSPVEDLLNTSDTVLKDLIL